MGHFRPSRRLAAAMCVAVLTPLAACEIVAGLTRPELVEGTETGVQADVSATVDSGVDPCGPRPPLAALGSQTVLDRITFAVKYVETPIVKSEVDPEPGRLCKTPAFDLDEVATCVASPDGGKGPPSCRPWDPDNVNCDDKDGLDNSALAALAQFTNGGVGDPNDDVNPELRDGAAGLLLDLAGYNGEDDDGDVTLSIIFAVGVDDGTGKPGAKPKWDGNDQWIGEKTSFFDNRPTYNSSSGYVRGGMLVARFRKPTPFNLGGSGSRLEAQQMVITGRIIRDTSGEAIGLDQGRIGARVAVSTALTYFGGRLANGEPVCGPLLRELVLTQVCRAADVLGSGPNDPTAWCDSISLGSGFYAGRAQRTNATLEFDAGVTSACKSDDAWPPPCSEAGF